MKVKTLHAVTLAQKLLGSNSMFVDTYRCTRQKCKQFGLFLLPTQYILKEEKTICNRSEFLLYLTQIVASFIT